jgi:hypothetical protein
MQEQSEVWEGQKQETIGLRRLVLNRNLFDKDSELLKQIDLKLELKERGKLPRKPGQPSNPVEEETKEEAKTEEQSPQQSTSSFPLQLGGDPQKQSSTHSDVGGELRKKTSRQSVEGLELKKKSSRQSDGGGKLKKTSK